jgi:hypothetical protein
LLNTLLQIGKDALKFGRIVGALYRDTVELEVQVWLTTPPIDTRPPPYRVTIADVTPLYSVYVRGNDDMPAWIAEMAALRARGLEPIPQAKFFYELGALMSHICDLITSEPTTKGNCQKSLPTPAVALTPVSAIGPTSIPFRIGDMTSRLPAGGSSQTKKQVSDAGKKTDDGNNTTPKPNPTPIVPANPSVIGNFELSLTPNDIKDFQIAACIPPTGASDLGPANSATRAAINAVITDSKLNQKPEVTDKKAILLRKRLKDGKLKADSQCPTKPTAPASSAAPATTPAAPVSAPPSPAPAPIAVPSPAPSSPAAPAST